MWRRFVVDQAAGFIKKFTESLAALKSNHDTLLTSVGQFEAGKITKEHIGLFVFAIVTLALVSVLLRLVFSACKRKESTLSRKAKKALKAKLRKKNKKRKKSVKQF